MLKLKGLTHLDGVWLYDESDTIGWCFAGDLVVPPPAPSPTPSFLRGQSLTHVWWLAGRRVTLQTRYFLRMVPQCVTSTFNPGTQNGYN